METGSWLTKTSTEGAPGEFEGKASVSIPVRLSSGIPISNFIVIQKGGTAPAECDNGVGTAPSAENPEADPGFFCLFIAETSDSSLEVFPQKAGAAFIAFGVSPSGGILLVASSANEDVWGTFAVTG